MFKNPMFYISLATLAVLVLILLKLDKNGDGTTVVVAPKVATPAAAVV